MGNEKRRKDKTRFSCIGVQGSEQREQWAIFIVQPRHGDGLS